jgi:hypothetical protein
MSQSPSQHELTQEQNALIGSLASKMRFVGRTAGRDRGRARKCMKNETGPSFSGEVRFCGMIWPQRLKSSWKLLFSPEPAS